MSIIFFDIDGTILDTDGYIPPSAAEAIRRLRQVGHMCVINTGRPRIALEPPVLALGFDGFVCTCGQYVELEGRVLRQEGFAPEVCRLLLDRGRQCGMELYFEAADGVWAMLSHEPDSAEFRGALRRLRQYGVCIRCPEEDPSFHFDKICVLPSGSSRTHEFLDLARPYCQIIDRGGGLYELPRKGFSKAEGCRAVARALNLDLADCFAIGDSTNDAEMLRCVGHPIVMGNASPQVKDLAEYVTAPLRADGLYRAMVHMGLLRD